MPSPPGPQFNWRGVIFIAIAFALVALAVLFRSGAVPSAPVSGQSTPFDWGHSLAILGGSIGFAVIALLGGYCGYLRAMKDSKAQDSRGAGPEI